MKQIQRIFIIRDIRVIDFPLRAVELNLLAKGDSVVGWKEGVE